MDRLEQKKWNERHFQICLALISRPVISTYGSLPSINFADIISKADRMVNLLKEREQEQSTRLVSEAKVSK